MPMVGYVGWAFMERVYRRERAEVLALAEGEAEKMQSMTESRSETRRESTSWDIDDITAPSDDVPVGLAQTATKWTEIWYVLI